MKRSDGRILTTHTGSLPRPSDLMELLNAREMGRPYDQPALAERVRRAIEDIVEKQAATGIDIPGDGEHSKVNWWAYARGRLSGLEEVDSPVRFRGETRDSLAFPGAYERHEADARGALGRARAQAHRATQGLRLLRAGALRRRARSFGPTSKT